MKKHKHDWKCLWISKDVDGKIRWMLFICAICERLQKNEK